MTRTLPLFPASPRTKDGPFTRRALCCRPGHHYYGPPRTSDGPAAAFAFWAIAAAALDQGRRQTSPVARCSVPAIPSPLRRRLGTVPRVGPPCPLLPSPSGTGLGFLTLADDAAGFASHFGLDGCRGPTVRARCGSLPGARPRPVGRHLAPRPRTGSGFARLSGLRWSARLPGSHCLLTHRPFALALPPAPAGSSPTYAEEGTTRLPTLPRPDFHRLDQRTLPGRTATRSAPIRTPGHRLDRPADRR